MSVMNHQVKIRVMSVAYHRNGVGGEGFHVVLFMYGRRAMLATVFDDPGCVAVLDAKLLQEGDIQAGSNSWRGDVFESALRKAIEDYRESR